MAKKVKAMTAVPLSYSLEGYKEQLAKQAEKLAIKLTEEVKDSPNIKDSDKKGHLDKLLNGALQKVSKESGAHTAAIYAGAFANVSEQIETTLNPEGKSTGTLEQHFQSMKSLLEGSLAHMHPLKDKFLFTVGKDANGNSNRRVMITAYQKAKDACPVKDNAGSESPPKEEKEEQALNLSKALAYAKHAASGRNENGPTFNSKVFTETFAALMQGKAVHPEVRDEFFGGLTTANEQVITMETLQQLAPMQRILDANTLASLNMNIDGLEEGSDAYKQAAEIQDAYQDITKDAGLSLEETQRKNVHDAVSLIAQSQNTENSAESRKIFATQAQETIKQFSPEEKAYFNYLNANKSQALNITAASMLGLAGKFAPSLILGAVLGALIGSPFAGAITGLILDGIGGMEDSGISLEQEERQAPPAALKFSTSQEKAAA